MRLGSFILVFVFLAGHSFAIDVVTDGPKTACRVVELYKDLKVFKDPSLFLSAVSTLYSDPVRGWKELRQESPLLTIVKGQIELMEIGPTRNFRGFISIAALMQVYEHAEPKLKTGATDASARIVPIRLCGGLNDPYADTLGFVLESDLEDAQKQSTRTGSLPPSVFPNPVPRLRK